MEDELAQLRERVEMLERRWEHLLEIHDNLAFNVSFSQDLDDGFIIPALLRLGGDAYRDQMLRWLARIEKTTADFVADGEGDERDRIRAQYWQDLLRKREPFPDFPPDGWMSPREP